MSQLFNIWIHIQAFVAIFALNDSAMICVNMEKCVDLTESSFVSEKNELAIWENHLRHY